MGALEDRIAAAREKKAAEDAQKAAELAAEKLKKDEADAAIAARANLKDRVSTALSDRLGATKKNLQDAKQTEDFVGTLQEMLVTSENAQAEKKNVEINAEVDAGIAELKGFGEDVSDEEIAVMRAEKLEPIETARKKSVESFGGGMLGEIVNASKKVGESAAKDEGLYDDVSKSVEDMDEEEHSAIVEALKTGGPEALAKFHGARTERLQKSERSAQEKKDQEAGYAKASEMISNALAEIAALKPEIDAKSEKIYQIVNARVEASPELVRVLKSYQEIAAKAQLTMGGFDQKAKEEAQAAVDNEAQAYNLVKIQLRSVYLQEESKKDTPEEIQKLAHYTGLLRMVAMQYPEDGAAKPILLANEELKKIKNGDLKADDVIASFREDYKRGEEHVLQSYTEPARNYELLNRVRQTIQTEEFQRGEANKAAEEKAGFEKLAKTIGEELKGAEETLEEYKKIGAELDKALADQVKLDAAERLKSHNAKIQAAKLFSGLGMFSSDEKKLQQALQLEHDARHSPERAAQEAGRLKIQNAQERFKKLDDDLRGVLWRSDRNMGDASVQSRVPNAQTLYRAGLQLRSLWDMASAGFSKQHMARKAELTTSGSTDEKSFSEYAEADGLVRSRLAKLEKSDPAAFERLKQFHESLNA